MNEHTSTVTFQGNPLTLEGETIREGQTAPDVTLVGADLSAVRLSSYRGKVCVIVSVPSLDTPVCDVEARRFNEEVARLGDDVQVLVISMDLPFAQKRWCGATASDRVVTLSDHRTAAFGTAYGVLIKELRLLARVVFVLDRNGVVRYIQRVAELTEEPDYAAVLDAIKKVV